MKLLNLFAIAAGYLTGNYIYQFFQAVPDWAYANHKTLEQGMALFIVILVAKVLE